MYRDETLLYEEGYRITINDTDAPLYYLFDYHTRPGAFSMSFHHFHPFYEVHILLNDRASHMIEGECYALQPYDIVLLRPSLLHKTEYPPAPEHRRLIINFRLPEPAAPLAEMTQQCLEPFQASVPIYRFRGEVAARVFGHLNEIFRLGKEPHTPFNDLSIHCNFLEFLCEIARHQRENQYEGQQPGDSVAHKIYAVTRYIHRHYESELTLESLSHRFFISPYYLSHQFRRVTGFSLIHYVQLTRLRNAQQMLLYTDHKIADIAIECGFTSFSQFNRVFNKFCGTTPSRFRTGGQIMPILAPPSEPGPSLGIAQELDAHS